MSPRARSLNIHSNTMVAMMPVKRERAGRMGTGAEVDVIGRALARAGVALRVGAGADARGV